MMLLIFGIEVIDLMQTVIRNRFDAKAAIVVRAIGQLHPRKLIASDQSSIERIVKATTFYDTNKVKVETELRLLCSSQIIHSAASYAEVYDLLEEEEGCFSSASKLMELGLTLPLTSCSAEQSWSLGQNL